MGRARGTSGGDGERVQGFGGKTGMKETTWKAKAKACKER